MPKYPQPDNKEQVYNKANSFTNIAGSVNYDRTLERILHLHDNIENIQSNLRAVVKQACSDVLVKSGSQDRMFTLQKMVLVPE